MNYSVACLVWKKNIYINRVLSALNIARARLVKRLLTWTLIDYKGNLILPHVSGLREMGERMGSDSNRVRGYPAGRILMTTTGIFCPVRSVLQRWKCRMYQSITFRNNCLPYLRCGVPRFYVYFADMQGFLSFPFGWPKHSFCRNSFAPISRNLEWGAFLANFLKSRN